MDYNIEADYLHRVGADDKMLTAKRVAERRGDSQYGACKGAQLFCSAQPATSDISQPLCLARLASDAASARVVLEHIAYERRKFRMNDPELGSAFYSTNF